MNCFLDIHGITVQIESENSIFLDVVRSNYRSFICEDVAAPNLNVNFSADSGEHAKQKKEISPRLSQGLHQNENSIYWENEFGFVISVELQSLKNWKINGYHFNLVKKNSEEEQLKNYIRSMRWMIHFPVFSLLKKFKSMRLVHASTISKDSEAIIFAGLNKVGKSSLSRYIFENYNYKYMSDNFLLTDSKLIYGFPENNRLSTQSIKHLNIESLNTNKIYGKHHIPFETKQIELIAKPKTVFIVNNFDSLEIKNISREFALNSLEAMHNYLQEFPEYTFYSMLDSFDSWKGINNPLFPEDANFFKIYLPMDWSLQEATDKVLECI
jgi:hypothetical protein